MKNEDEVLFATYIAMQVACGKSDEEVRQILDLLNQVCCSLGNLLSCRGKRK